MYIIVGLGNPDDKYAATRHNAGFDTLDRLADRHDIRICSKEHLAMTGKGYICGQKVILAKPMTYMNKSGDSIAALADYYKIDVTEELIVIYDDIAMPLEKIRIRPEGSAGGHNGIKSIIARLGTQEFPRVRIGIGAKPEEYDLVDHVLGRFSPEDRKIVESSMERACDAVEMMITAGIERAMNNYN